MEDDERERLFEWRIKQVEQRAERIEHKVDVMKETLATKHDVHELQTEIEKNREIMEKKAESTTNFWLRSIIGPAVVAICSVLATYLATHH